DLLHALPPGADRVTLRVHLAEALVHRISGFLDARRTDRVDGLLGELVQLWTDEPAAMAAELGPYAPVLERARAAFARAGSDRESAMVLALLVVAEPARAAAHRAELDEVLAYADDL